MADSKLNYQQLKDELEEVLNQLQHEDTDIDKAVELHKKGKKLLKDLEAYLGNIAEKTDIKIKPDEQ